MPDIKPEWTDRGATPLDFIIVGAGAGGAPLAARLAERGYEVLVAEMGPGRPAPPPGAVVENTEVPLLHPEVTEDPRHSLRYFVKHFDTDPAGSLDPKVYPPPGAGGDPKEDEHGIFYPRAQGLGGCTVHNAMITVSGPSEDWDQIAEATGDPSWRGERMRAYFQRVEKCQYNAPSRLRRFLARFGLRTGWEDARHGDGGWLETTWADLNLLVRDRRLLRVVFGAALGALENGVETFRQLFDLLFGGRSTPSLDPNHWETMRKGGEGLARIPCAVSPTGKRSDPRARLLGVKEHPLHGRRLHLLTGVCVTGLALNPDAPPAAVGGQSTTLRAVGVRCLPQENVYEAVASPQPRTAQEVTLYCRRDVILCGGSFNTPQLLMLSGIGPKAHLERPEVGVTCVRDLPGVGENLQDRYEVPVVATVTRPFETLAGTGLTSRGPAAQADRWLQQWVAAVAANEAAKREAAGMGTAPAYRDAGLYATNGGLIAILKRSRQEDSVPDLFIFALAGFFRGYHVGYSKPATFIDQIPPAEAAQQLPQDRQDAQNSEVAVHPRDTITWLILKARTRQHGGYVRLRSGDPLRRPEINFRSFPKGDSDPDLLALVEGVEFVRGFLRAGQPHAIKGFECPGLDDPRFGGKLAEWVRNVAWGHHACGTCRIGADDDAMAVLDARFRVRGVQGLRVVDASVFPRIPGVFIVANVYMAAEKAADVVTEDNPLGQVPEECRAELERVPVLLSRPQYEARRAYPVELEAAEAELIRRRRDAAERKPPAANPTPAEGGR